MDGHEFYRKVKRLGRQRGVAVTFEPRHGKGSHGRLYYGDHFATLKDRKKEIGPGLYRQICIQLGINPSDL